MGGEGIWNVGGAGGEVVRGEGKLERSWRRRDLDGRGARGLEG